MMTAGTSVPVVPCHLQGTFQAFPPNTKLPRLHKVTVQIGKPRVFTDQENKRSGWDEVTRILEDDVRGLAGKYESSGANDNGSPPGGPSG